MLDDQLKAALQRRAQRGMLRSLTLFDSLPATFPPPAPPSPSPHGHDHEPLARAAPALARAYPPPSPSLASTSNPPTTTTTTTTTRTDAMVDFSSNDYLSLSTSPAMLDHFRARVASPGSLRALGSRGSRLLDGNTEQHEQVEALLSSHFGSPTALLFNSGYDANVSLLSTLPQPDDVVLHDELVHASAHDGMRKSRTRRRVAFRHNDVAHLEALLRELVGGRSGADAGAAAAAASSSSSSSSSAWDASTRGDVRSGRSNVFLVVESVYSMDGDVAPLRDMVRAMARWLPCPRSRHVVVDEAHSTGVFGRAGRGLCEELGVVDDVAVRLVTFGKAMGCSGAAVLCSPLVRQYLINYARPLIFSTSLSPPSLLAIEASMHALGLEGDARRERLRRNVASLLPKLRRLCRGQAAAAAGSAGQRAHEGRPLLHLVDEEGGSRGSTHQPAQRRGGMAAAGGVSPIVALLTPRARELGAHLRSKGLVVRSVCYPTVPMGRERVRICVHADNDERDVEALAAAVEEWVRSAASARTDGGRGEGDRITDVGQGEGRGAAASRTSAPPGGEEETRRGPDAEDMPSRLRSEPVNPTSRL